MRLLHSFNRNVSCIILMIYGRSHICAPRSCLKGPPPPYHLKSKFLIQFSIINLLCCSFCHLWQWQSEWWKSYSTFLKRPAFFLYSVIKITNVGICIWPYDPVFGRENTSRPPYLLVQGLQQEEKIKLNSRNLGLDYLKPCYKVFSLSLCCAFTLLCTAPME